MNQRLLTVVVLTSVVLVTSIGVGTWILWSKERKRNLSTLQPMSTALDCYDCQKCTRTDEPCPIQCEKLRHRCREQKLEYTEVITNTCKNDPTLTDFTTKTIKSKYEEAKRKVQERYHNDTITNYFSSSKTSLYNPGKFILHLPLNISQQVQPNVWIEVWNYVTDVKVQTVLGDATNVLSQGHISIPDSGLYYVYSKITFACTEADFLTKRVIMEVVNDKTYKNNTILAEMQTATCEEKGDLFTMFQSGLIRLRRKSKIFLRYIVPDNVTISKHDLLNNYYKSSFGMYWFGLG